MSSFYSY